MLITDQVATAPCTDCVQAQRPTFEESSSKWFLSCSGMVIALERLATTVSSEGKARLHTRNPI